MGVNVLSLNIKMIINHFSENNSIYNYKFIILLFHLCSFLSFIGHIYNHSLNISIGIWSGKDVLSTRVFNMSKTWFRFWKEVYVFSDEFPNYICTEIQKNAAPCEVHCEAIINYSDHLDGTRWDFKWAKAQPRFLPAMARLYEIRPNSDWYMFCDDDSYVFYSSLQKNLPQYNPNSTIVLGFYYHMWSHIFKYFPQELQLGETSDLFPQGGAGIIMSSSTMKRVSSHLINCSNSFNSPTFAASMRFSACMKEVLGDEWEIGKAKVHWDAYLSGYDNLRILSFPQYEGTPVVLHHIVENAFIETSFAHFFEYTPSTYFQYPQNSFISKKSLSSFTNSKKNKNIPAKKYYGDLGLFSFTSQLIQLGCYDCFYEWIFGFFISEIHSYIPFSKAISPFQVQEYQHGDKIEEELVQYYENNITIKCRCFEGLPTGNLTFSHLEGDFGNIIVMLMPCSNISLIEAI